MKSIFATVLFAVFALFVIVFFAAPQPVHAQQEGLGAAECISSFSTNDGFIHYRNNCGGGFPVNIVVMSPNGSWGPSLLSTGGEVIYSQQSGPFRFWACKAPAIPINPQSGWIPRYTDGYVVCKQ